MRNPIRPCVAPIRAVFGRGTPAGNAGGCCTSHLHAHGGEHQLGDERQHGVLLEVGVREQDVLHGMEQDVGGGVEEESELVGGEAVARHPVGVQIGLQFLYHQLHGASCAVARLMDVFPRPVEVGHYEAHVGSEFADLYLDDDAQRVPPDARLVHELAIPC